MLYNERSIGDVMEMTLEQAAEFFARAAEDPSPARSCSATPASAISTRPAQPDAQRRRSPAAQARQRTHPRPRPQRDRRACARHREPKSTLYLLEEPTIGLHMADVAELLNVLHRLVDDGHTVIVIEHNLSLIADADYVVDIGPEAGDGGGEVVAVGTPEEVAKSKTQPHRAVSETSLNSESRRKTSTVAKDARAQRPIIKPPDWDGNSLFERFQVS